MELETKKPSKQQEKKSEFSVNTSGARSIFFNRKQSNSIAIHDYYKVSRERDTSHCYLSYHNVRSRHPSLPNYHPRGKPKKKETQKSIQALTRVREGLNQ